jgi:23S rRNA (adenine2503-C2)-methyltransferase
MVAGVARHPLLPASVSPNLLDFTVVELAGFAVSHGEPSFRGVQLAGWLYQRLAIDVHEMTDLPRSFRESLARSTRIGGAIEVDAVRTSDGGTEKLLLRLPDGATIETVLMRQRTARGRRNTLCISSQVGCAVGCPFCATGQAGWFRNLSPGEIVEQVLMWARRLAAQGESVQNIVYMGMGEPLGNYDAVWRSIRTLHDARCFGLGARHITLSTSGIAPRIERLAEEDMPVNLAVSLHAADDALRDVLVPLNKRYPLARLLEACRSYVAQSHRRISFEYVLIRNVNDSPTQAAQLADLVGGLLCHINVIPLNPEPSSYYAPPTPDVVDAFAAVLRGRRLPVTIRRERGQEIAAACGQLRAASDGRAQRLAKAGVV